MLNENCVYLPENLLHNHVIFKKMTHYCFPDLIMLVKPSIIRHFYCMGKTIGLESEAHCLREWRVISLCNLTVFPSVI